MVLISNDLIAVTVTLLSLLQMNEEGRHLATSQPESLSERKQLFNATTRTRVEYPLRVRDTTR